MYDALQPIDRATGKSRGYALLSYSFSDHEHTGMPRSILFRSNKVQDPVRRLYKTFLAKQYKEHQKSVTFQQVLDFWTKGGKDFDYIWSVLDPQLAPTNEEEETIVENARSLLKELTGGMGTSYDERLRRSKSICTNACSGPSCQSTSQIPSRNVDISPLEAIFVVYLSSLPPGARKELVYKSRKETNDDTSVPKVTYEQLICEAELVQYAIEASGEDALDN